MKTKILQAQPTDTGAGRVACAGDVIYFEKYLKVRYIRNLFSDVPFIKKWRDRPTI
jgi:hypothetical protein